MAKGQAMAEFMLMMLATLIVVALLFSGLAGQARIAEGKLKDVESAGKAEAAARAVEVAMDSGAAMDLFMADGGVSFSIEGGRLHAGYDGKVIEVGGVFSEDGSVPV